MSQITRTPTQAVRVSYGAPYNNYDGQELRVGVQSSTSTRYMSLVQFDISAIPANSIVSSAYVKLYSFSDECWRAAATQLCQRVTSSWSEGSVTYNARPSVTTSNQSSHTTSGSYDTWEQWTVTNIVQEWVNGTSNYGLWFIQDGLTTSLGKAYHDENMSNAPILVVNYTTPTACGAPTSCSVSPTIAESSATLSWGGATSGKANSIVGYDIDYCESSDGSSWGSWITLASVTSTLAYGSRTVNPHSTRGYYRKYRVRTKGSLGSSYYSGYKESTNTLKKNEVPNTISGTPSLSTTNAANGETVRISFTNAGGDNLAGYEVAMKDDSDVWYNSGQIMGTNASASATYVDVSTSGWSTGNTWKFLVRGYDSFGIRGSWSAETALLTIGAEPSMPRTVLYDGGTESYFESPVRVSWSAPLNTYGLDYTYEVRIGEWNGSSYDYGSAISTGTTAYYDLVLTGYSRGDRLYVQVRATNEVGDSDWKGNEVDIFYNQIPAQPTLIFPKANTTIYNLTPRIGFTYGIDADGQAVLGTVEIDSVDKDATTDYWSNKGSKTTAASSLVQGWTLAAGEYTADYLSNDGLIDNTEQSVTFNVAEPSWTDSTLVSGSTPIKAVHITELRDVIDDIYDYYGLTNPTWTDTLTSGTTPIMAVHLTEMRNAIEAVRTYVNGFDSGTSKDIAAFSWTDSTLTNKRIKAVHIQELRNAVVTL